MSVPALETYLARLYSEKSEREKFLADPENEARNAGLSDADTAAICKIDRAGLCMAGASYANKREQHKRPRRKLYDVLTRWLARR